MRTLYHDLLVLLQTNAFVTAVVTDATVPTVTTRRTSAHTCKHVEHQ